MSFKEENEEKLLMTRRYLIKALAALGILTAVGCSKDKDEDVNVSAEKIRYDPTVQDEEDKILNDQSDSEPDFELQPGESWVSASPDEYYIHPAQFSQAAVQTRTYGTRNGGRQAFRIKPRFGRRGQYAYVVFSDRPRTAYRVKLWYANRINSGSHNGFVFKLGSMGDFFCHSPYGRNPQYVTVYY